MFRPPPGSTPPVPLLPHSSLFRSIAGLLFCYLAAIILGVIDAAFLQNLRDLPWFGLPAAPALDLACSPILIVPFLIATIASNIKLVGLITSAQRTNDVNWRRPDMASIRGGIVADSIGNISAGVLGGVGTAVGAGNIGLAAATGATSRTRSEEHTSELQSLMRISYAVFCLKKKK